MSKKNNNLVEIAKVLIEMREERELHGVPSSILSRYPEGSQGIVINEDKFIVLNSDNTTEIKDSTKVNTLKDNSLKYNPNFYLGTHESDEPDIIDEAHNKSKLINEAYTEVSFLPKDIYSTGEFNREEAEKALKVIIDKRYLNSQDFDSYVVDKRLSTSNVYDEIYRCRCIFTDISGNESVESILIKAFKVSEKEHSYQIINSENIKEQVDELENKVNNDTTGEMKTTYSNISDLEIENITKHIREGIEQYYTENSKKFYRLIEVTIKAIYCLRLKKTPMEVILNSKLKTVARLQTYYSMVSSDFNVFICPNCKTLSNRNTYGGMKIHVDHDFIDRKHEDALGGVSPIGCTTCMEYCEKCGRWHFKLTEYNNVINKGFNPIGKRRFLMNYAGKEVSPVELCSCKENLTWIYDEMGTAFEAHEDSNMGGKRIVYDRIVDKFLTGSCKLAFVNYFTGEVVAKYDDFIKYFYEYLFVYLKKQKTIFPKYKEIAKKSSKLAEIKNHVFTFVEMYKSNDGDVFKDFRLEEYAKNALEDFKLGLVNAFNIPEQSIKATTLGQTAKCSCCGGLYYKSKNAEGEMYFNDVKDTCACCSEALNRNYRMWNRADDGITFYKPKNKDVVIRTFQGKSGEELYDKWLETVLSTMIDKLKTMKA